MSKANGDSLSYGRPRSQETKDLISIRLREVLKKKGEYRNCPVCGNEYYVYPSTVKRCKGKFCSKSCAAKSNNKDRDYKSGKEHSNWRGGPNIFTCEICGEEVRSRKKIARFCSAECKDKAHSKYMLETPPMVPCCDTDIERILESWLIENDIEHEKQTVIKDICRTDFFVQPNICIFADGDYWHQQKKTVVRDKWVNRQLEKNGYKIIRILGSDIKKGVRPDELLLHQN
jgi:very-short-patch-repair endonuclease